MSDETATGNVFPQTTGADRNLWSWHPPLPIAANPVLVWPPRPTAVAKWLPSYLLLLIPFTLVAIATWSWLQPAIESCVNFEAGWILQMFVRNLALMFLVAGGLHLFFYRFKRQGMERRFDAGELIADDPEFFTRNQVRDNIFWSCASGVPIWTAYEVLFMWAYANEMLPFYLDWTTHPISFVAIILAIPFWQSFHFYITHRPLHWKPMYRFVHAVHHRNDNIGPWSGLSMHPIEHVIYFSSVLIHLVLASHPLHVMLHMQWNALGAVTSHAGYECLLFKGRPVVWLGDFYHQLHHRFYNSNYGARFVPFDRWFGTNNDGTPESMVRIRAHRRARRASA